VTLRSRKYWLIILGVYVAVCFVFGLFPHHGPPHFRYTGADPDFNVWNLGWPLATMIWDARSGLHIGPFAYVLFPALFVLGVAILALAMLLRGVSSGAGRDQRSRLYDTVAAMIVKARGSRRGR